MLHIKHVALNKQTYFLKSTLETNIRAQLMAGIPTQQNGSGSNTRNQLRGPLVSTSF